MIAAQKEIKKQCQIWSEGLYLKFSQFSMEFHSMDLDSQDFSSQVFGIAVGL